MRRAGVLVVGCSRVAAPPPGKRRSPRRRYEFPIVRRGPGPAQIALVATGPPMADKKSPRTPLQLSPEALFRYQIVSAVKARELSGQGTDAAVREVAAQHHLTIAGEPKTAAVRSIYRWLAELDRDGPSGIETAHPERAISRRTCGTRVSCRAPSRRRGRRMAASGCRVGSRPSGECRRRPQIFRRAGSCQNRPPRRRRRCT